MQKIKLINIKKSFGDKEILNIQNLVIQDNQKIGIVGKNGSGKSTLLNLIAQITKPDEGIIDIKGKISYIKQLDNIQENKENSKSGGEKMLEIINQKFQENSDILLADEPSSNLDINNIEYLIKKLQNYKGTILLISHDRNVLDSVCTSILEIADGKINQYKGNYADYKKQKEMETNRKKFEYSQYIKSKEKLEQAIIKSKNSSKSVKKAPKRMGNSEARLHKREATEIKEKLDSHTKALETRLNQLEEKEKLPKEYIVNFKVPESNIIKSKEIIKSDNFSLKVNNKELLVNTKFYIPTNKKIAIIGKNGIGKTSLVTNIISKNSQIKINSQAIIGYFSQKLDNLNENETVLENVIKDSIQNEITVRNILANLYIRENQVYEKVKDLSGGEKVKTALAKILVSNANLLILDEPTNFLDIESIEALENLIKKYKGTVIVISHDRKFIDNVCDNIILIENKKIIQYDGNYSKYLQHKDEKVKKNLNNNEKLLLEFKLTKLNSELAFAKSEEEKRLIEKEIANLLSK